MREENLTKKQLIEALKSLRSRVAESEKTASELRHVERDVLSSEERFKVVYRCLPIPTITWQKQGNDFVIIDYNTAAAEFTDGLLANFIGKRAKTVYSNRPDLREYLARCFEGKTVIKEESPYRMFTKGDKKLIDFTFAYAPPDLVLCHLEDITRRRTAEEKIARSERQLRALSSRLLTAAENERKRIARELHDSIGQYLTAIKLNAENTASLLDGRRYGEAEHALTAGIPVIRQTIDEIRRIMMDLRPTILDDLGILATLSWLCRELQAINPHMAIARDIRIAEEEIPEPLKIIIYRIVQESLNNAVKHSHAAHIRIGLKKTRQQTVLTVADDGIGFDPHKAINNESDKGVGLISMRERAELSGGAFAIRSQLRRGTTVRASWPYLVTSPRSMA